MSVNSGIPFEHFLRSTGLVVRIAGSFNGEDYSLNVVLMKGHKTADIRESKLIKSVVGFSMSSPASVVEAMSELVKQISGQTVCFGDEEVRVPELSYGMDISDEI